jgi:hypothetical protein
VHARWPVGPVCRACYLRARLHPAPSGGLRAGPRADRPRYRGNRLCGPCSGSSTDYTCAACGEGNAFHDRGCCERCGLQHRIAGLLASLDGEVAAGLQPLAEALTWAAMPCVSACPVGEDRSRADAIRHYVMVSISDRDRKILWGRSGNRCALCRRILVAERTSGDDDAVVGDEAHIAAQSPGGPRYGECAPSAVNSYENLILLCKVDHKMVDDQKQHFTSARLLQTRKEHEAWVEHILDGLPEPPGDPRHVNNPLIATVEREALPRVLTVDDEPPKEISGSGNLHVIVLEAWTMRAVQLRAIRPVVRARRPPRRACLAPPRIGGIIEPRPFTVDFDDDNPILQALGVDFPFKVSATDIEQFDITPRVTTGEVAWHLELDWICEGRRGTTITDDDGKPFEIYPTPMLSSSPGLDWGCGFNGHVRGCPAERLAALRRAGSQSIPRMADAQAVIEAIEEEFPGWAVWHSDAGIWYATWVGAPASRSATLSSDTADGLRIRLRRESREP